MIAFETDIPHWLSPELFSVQPGPNNLPEQELIQIVERRFAPARVGSVQVPGRPNPARVMQLPGRVSVLLNPYNGSISGTVIGGHQIHLRLIPNPQSAPRLSAIGKTIRGGPSHIVVSLFSLLLVMAVTGMVIWWRKPAI